MEGKRFIKTLTLKNFLSFGPEGQTIELEPLNVLIGPNASGKSNFLDAFSILRATTTDLSAVFRQGGGINEWLYKGSTKAIEAEIVATLPTSLLLPALRYRLCLAATGFLPSLTNEVIELLEPTLTTLDGKPERYLYRNETGQPAISIARIPQAFLQPQIQMLDRNQLRSDQSILSQLKDPIQYPVLTGLAQEFFKIHMYREWHIGRGTADPIRMPQRADARPYSLEEDGSNLWVVLNNLESHFGIKQRLLERMKLICEDIRDFTVGIQGGAVLGFLHETGPQESVPATRMSDGTLRFFFLLSILSHPEPPPLVCIEEPEVGLHPDAIKTVGELLVEASQRTQLIVTTHSDILVSALTEIPESVIVCEHDGHGTQLRRLENEPLKEWLKDYSLGEVWRMGEIGGNRW